MTLSLALETGRYGVARLAPDAPVPDWASRGRLVSVTRTPRELSIVCDEGRIPEEVLCERGFRALFIEGPLPFSLTGILAGVVSPLAAARISVFAFSTYDTDYVLVKEEALDAAVAAIRGAGHSFAGPQTT